MAYQAHMYGCHIVAYWFWEGPLVSIYYWQLCDHNVTLFGLHTPSPPPHPLLHLPPPSTPPCVLFITQEQKNIKKQKINREGLWNVDVGGTCPTTSTCALNLLFLTGQMKYSQMSRPCAAWSAWLWTPMNENGPSKFLHIFFYQIMDYWKVRWSVHWHDKQQDNCSWEPKTRMYV